ncbi:MAG: aminopeptidase [Deltaproteobacteria bacterium]|nr:aminopeptidase [Deltaproteobacteria bacterium]
MRCAAGCVLAGVVAGGCVAVRYVPQAVRGQAQLLLTGREVAAVVADPQTDPNTRALLSHVGAVKRFARAQGLTPTSSYERFVDVGRTAVVWVVSAAPPLSLEPVRWDVPVLGPFPYLGWFSQEDAAWHARRLRAQGLDVDVRPASAYSTLGWTRDPVLSTMLGRGPDAAGQLADVLLHESVHATLHVPGDTAFNEGLASFLAEQLTPRFLAEQFGAESAEARAWADTVSSSERRAARMHQAARALQALYASPLPVHDKLARKWRAIALLREELGTARWLNNASLAQFLVYESASGAFAALLARCDGDTRRFLAWMAAERTLAVRRSACP